MHVPGPRRQRRRDPADAEGELHPSIQSRAAIRTYVLCCGDAGRVPRGAVPERAQPRQGDAVRVVAEPLHGLRAPLHVLLRARVRAARRPALRRPLRTLDPRQGRTSPRCSRASSRGRRGRGSGRDRRRHRPVPAGRGPLPADARLHRGARPRGNAVRAHHARADDRPRRRRAAGGGAAGRRLRHLLGAHARPRRLADDRARHGAAAPAAARADDARRRRRARRASAWRRSCPGSPTGRSSSRRSSARRARPARRGIWANVLYLAPGTREHFLEALARDWPEQLERYEELYARRAYLPRATVDPVARAGAQGWPGSTASATAAPRRCAPPPEPVQLALRRVKADPRNTLPRRCPTRSPA